VFTTVAHSSDLFVRDFLSGVTLSQHQLEVSGDYLIMNDTVDVFDIRESRRDSISSTFDSETIGDLEGGRLLVAYGISDEWMLSGGYTYRDTDISITNFEIDSYTLALSKRFNLNADDTLYAFAVMGGRYNACSDFSTSNVSEIDYFAKKISGNYSVSEAPGRVEISDGTLTLSSPIVERDGTFKDPLTLGMEDSTDYSFFARFGVGKRWQNVNLALFAELGHTEISGSLTHNLDQYGVDPNSSVFAGLDSSLDRDEDYAKAGFDLYWETTRGIAANFAYYYQVLQRDSGLEDYDDNHVLKGDIIIWLNRSLALDVGATYYSSHFNGVIPLMYNKYTQSSFDHDYGVVHCGLILTLGRD
jgi:hypothetical protein